MSAEVGAVVKNPGGKLNIALVYPNTYFVGMLKRRAITQRPKLR